MAGKRITGSVSRIEGGSNVAVAWGVMAKRHGAAVLHTDLRMDRSHQFAVIVGDRVAAAVEVKAAGYSPDPSVSSEV
jgi:hypothetical protein